MYEKETLQQELIYISQHIVNQFITNQD